MIFVVNFRVGLQLELEAASSWMNLKVLSSMDAPVIGGGIFLYYSLSLPKMCFTPPSAFPRLMLSSAQLT